MISYPIILKSTFKKALLFLSILIGLPLSASSESIKWLIKPEYDAIDYFSETLFLCKKDGQYQIIDLEGEKLLPFAADSITNYSEGIALVLNKHGHDFKIDGFFMEEGNRFTSIEGDFLMGPYSYFSEGLLSVIDANTGKVGYLNANGSIVIPCKYRQARPFLHGWASVMPARKRNRTLYIDKHENVLNITGFHSGTVIMGSSFNEAGEALVAYYENDNAVINAQGEIVRKYIKNGNVTPIRSHDFAFDESTSPRIPKTNKTPTFDPSITLFLSDDLFGYKKGEQIIAPAQFTYAKEFANRSAIVSTNSKYGVICLAEGEVVGALQEGDIVVAPGKDPTPLAYSFNLPQSLDLQTIQVKFDMGDGVLQPVTLQNNTYTFTPILNEEDERCVMQTQVIADGLLLWDETMTREVNNVRLSFTSPTVINGSADENNIVKVFVVVTNNSGITVNIATAFSAVFANGSKNTIVSNPYSNVRIGPHKKMEFYLDIKVLEPENNVKVAFSIRANQKSYGTKASTISLKPFY